MQTYSSEWDKSYLRYENGIFFPKEECVKFLNRFIRKKIGADQYVDLLDFSKTVRGLDFGCGIGRQTILMEEMGIQAYGYDISTSAIEKAKKLALLCGYPELSKRFSIIPETGIPVESSFFDIALCERVLDSLHFALAKTIMLEFDRVVAKYVYLSLLTEDNEHEIGYSNEERVTKEYERGTIQSYFDWDKVQVLIQGTRFRIVFARLISECSLIDSYKNSRYHIVLEKKHA